MQNLNIDGSSMEEKSVYYRNRKRQPSIGTLLYTGQLAPRSLVDSCYALRFAIRNFWMQHPAPHDKFLAESLIHEYPR